jgi:hypothetical protein
MNSFIIIFKKINVSLLLALTTMEKFIGVVIRKNIFIKKKIKRIERA